MKRSLHSENEGFSSSNCNESNRGNMSNSNAYSAPSLSHSEGSAPNSFLSWLSELSAVLDGEGSSEIDNEETIIRLRNILRPTVNAFLDSKNGDARGVKHILQLFNHIVKKSPGVFCVDDDAKHSGPFLLKLLWVLGSPSAGMISLHDDIIVSITALLKLLYSKALIVVCAVFHDLTTLIGFCCHGHCQIQWNLDKNEPQFSRSVELLRNENDASPIEFPSFDLEDREIAEALYVSVCKLLRNIIGLAAPFISEFTSPRFWWSVAAHLNVGSSKFQNASLELLCCMMASLTVPSMMHTDVLEFCLSSLLAPKPRKSEFFTLMASCLNFLLEIVGESSLRCVAGSAANAAKVYLSQKNIPVELKISLIRLMTLTIKCHPQSLHSCEILLAHIDNPALHDCICECIIYVLREGPNLDYSIPSIYMGASSAATTGTASILLLHATLQQQQQQSSVALGKRDRGGLSQVSLSNSNNKKSLMLPSSASVSHNHDTDFLMDTPLLFQKLYLAVVEEHRSVSVDEMDQLHEISLLLKVLSAVPDLSIEWNPILSLLQSMFDRVLIFDNLDQMAVFVQVCLCLSWCIQNLSSATASNKPAALKHSCALVDQSLSKMKISAESDPVILSRILLAIRCNSNMTVSHLQHIKFVKQVLCHPVPEVRCDAVSTLSRLCSPNHLEEILKLLGDLTNDDSDLVTAAVGSAIGTCVCSCCAANVPLTMASESQTQVYQPQPTIPSQLSDIPDMTKTLEEEAPKDTFAFYPFPKSEMSASHFRCGVCVKCDNMTGCLHVHNPPKMCIDLTVFFSKFLTLLDGSNRDTDTRLAMLDSVIVLIRHASEKSLRKSPGELSTVLQCVGHDEFDVRMKMQEVIKVFVCGPMLPLRVMFGEDQPYRQLYQLFGQQLAASTDVAVQVSLCRNVASAAAAMSKGGEFVPNVIELLLHYASRSNVVVAAAAYNSIRLIASQKGMKLQVLMEQHKEPIYAWFLQRFDDSLWEAMASAFDKAKLDLLTDSVQTALWRIVKRQHKEVLATVAQKLGTDSSGLVADHLDIIMSSLFSGFEEKEFTESMIFLHELTLLEVQEMLSSGSAKKMVFPLIWDLGDESQQPDAVISRIMLVWGYLQDNNGLTENCSLADRFALSFLELMDYIIDRSSKSDVAHKKHGLRVVAQLMTRIQDHLKRFVPKIMSAFSFFAQQPELRSQVCQLWFALVKQLGPQSTQLRINLSQIVVNVLGFLSSDAGTVVQILEYLVIDCRDQLRSYFQEIPMMPDNPLLANVAKVFNEEVQGGTLKQGLLRIANCLHHEDPNVRYIALQQVQTQLKDNREQMMEFMKGEVVDDVIRDLVGKLLQGCCNPTWNVRLLSALCLGEIGAVDPTKMQIQNRPKIFGVQSDDDLAKELIVSHLVRHARGCTSNKDLTMILFAIQELLKFLKCRPKDDTANSNTKNSKRSDQMELFSPHPKVSLTIWQSFSVEVQEVIHPCLHSRYLKKNAQNIDKEHTTGPIYHPKIRFEVWIARWCIHLIKKSRPPRDEIFQPCRSIIRNHVDTAMFLLPHVAFDVLKNGTEDDRKQVKEEVMAVLGQDSSTHDSIFQCVFSLLDTLNRWADTSRKYKSHQSNDGGDDVLRFLNEIPKEIMAKASYRCKAYARALMYQEAHMREHKATNTEGYFSKETVAQLQRIYVNIDEPDGLKGIAQLQSHSDLNQRVLDFENAMDWNAALACYEQLLQSSPDQLQYHHGLLRCLHHLQHFETMLSHSYQLPHSSLRTYGLEAAWRLRRWDKVHELLPLVPNDHFEGAVAQCLLSLHRGDAQGMMAPLQRARNNLNSPLSAASMESYVRSLPYIVQLHILREIEDAKVCLMQPPTGKSQSDVLDHRLSEEAINVLKKDWDRRLALVQPSVEHYEVILAVRRVIYSMVPLPSLIGDAWLDLAKVASITGDSQAAMSATLQASMLDHPKSTLQRAKLLWKDGNRDTALSELHHYICTHPRVDHCGEDTAVRKVWGRSTLCYWNWMNATNRISPTEALDNILPVLKSFSQWDTAFFEVAKLSDAVFQLHMQRVKQNESAVMPSDKKQQIERGRIDALKMLPNILCYYGQCLHFGYRHAYTALPRMLTLWFEHTIIEPLKKNTSSSPSKFSSTTVHMEALSAVKEIIKFMTELIRSEKIPSCVWMTALPQLVSRICHPNQEVADCLNALLAKITLKHPQQTLWALACVKQSVRRLRKDNALKITQTAQRHALLGTAFAKQMADFDSLVSELSKLCVLGSEIKDKKQRTVNLPRKIHNMTTSGQSSQVIVPLQSSLTPQLPDKPPATDPFHSPATIAKFQDPAEVMVSAQHPIKVGIVDSSGVLRYFLCKPKDDLRKDSRLMEFSTMVNRLLHKSGLGRRKMQLRTFAVIPLNESCGMLEWVPNTATLRSVLGSFYHPPPVGHPQIQEWHKQINKKAKMTHLEWFNKVKGHFPPILHKWLLNSFPDPAAWFDARVTYARSTAVWSIVGYIVGLGDRHAENVLLDTASGECVHVDFACLFNKGEELSVPEKVPFRLTPNMVDALGVCGHAGVFRETCVLTLNVLRNNHDTLMNVLDSFLHDPLVEWSQATPSTGSEGNNPGAVKHCKNIENRLKGIEGGQQLSPEGQADCLIAQATDDDRLSKMYIWWMPWF